MVRKICRWMVRTVAVLGILLLAAGTALYFFFPGKLLQEYLLTTLGTVFDRRIELGTIRVNPFRGIVIRDLAMYDPESFGAKEFISMGELVLKYRLPPLLDRKIMIDEVSITRPSVTFTRTRDGAMNVDDLLRMVAPAESTAADTAAADTGAFAFVFDVHTFSIRDIRAALDGPHKISLGGLSISVSKAVIRPPDTYRGTVRITAGQAGHPNLIYIQNDDPSLPEKLLTRLDMDLTVTMNDLDSVSCRGPVILHALETVLGGRLLPRVAAGIRMEAYADLLRGRFRLADASLLFQQDEVMTLEAVVDELYTAPAGSVAVTGGTLPLAQVSTLLSRFLPGITAGGRVSLAGTRAAFSADSSFTAITTGVRSQVRLTDFRFSDTAAGLTARAGAMTFDGRHTFGLTGSVPSLQSGGTMVVHDAHVSLDSLDVPLGGMSCDYSATAEGSYLPYKATVTAALTDIFSGSVSLDMAAGTDGDPLQDIRIQALVSADRLDLSTLPVMPVRGICSAAISVAGSSWSDIAVSITADLDSAAYPLENRWETLPAFRFATDLRIGAEPPSFDAITIRDVRGSLGSLLQFSADADIKDYGTGGITLRLTGSELNLAELPAWAPSSVINGIPVLDSITLAGTAAATAEIRTALPESDTTALAYDAGVTVHIRNAGCRLPAAGITCEGLAARMTANADPSRIEPAMELTIDRTMLTMVRPAPFQGVHLSIKAVLDDFENLVIRELTAGIDEAGTEITAQGNVTGLSRGGTAVLTAGLSVTNTVPYEPLPGITFTGDMDGEFRITLPDINRMRGSLSGGVRFTGIHAALEKDIRVRDVTGSLELHHTVDLDSMRIIPEDPPPPHMTEEDPTVYGAYGSLVRNDLPGLSSITVGRVEYGPYYLGRIRADLLVRSTILDIKEFSIDDLYGGNLAGNLRLDLGNGRLDDFARQLQYRFYAQLAEASAESLIKSIPALRNTRAGSKSFKDDYTRICADLNFRGKGLNFAENPSLEGGINFTKIGPKVTVKLLALLDPDQTDRSFNTIRLFLNNGYRPVYYSTKIQHNNIYAVIKLDEPYRTKVARVLTLGAIPYIPQPIEQPRKSLVSLINTLGLEEVLRF